MAGKVQDKANTRDVRKKRALAVGALVGELVGPSLAKKGALLAQIVPHWGAICPLLARYSFPESVKGEVLTIGVDSDAVKQELLYMSPQVIEGVNMLAGYEAVSKVRAVTRAGGKKAPKVALRAEEAPASDKAGLVCQSVRDDGLRAALTRLGARILGK